ncbi:unnamed protein product [Meganyctiphanes norvegica]|uniref:S-adenosylmethionine sensor upstream of mTORC1 n=1 Tax=Meganyctiphanes norvegica TaxID=48144 RepID=A0AAV2Q3U6_MEGNR
MRTKNTRKKGKAETKTCKHKCVRFFAKPKNAVHCLSNIVQGVVYTNEQIQKKVVGHDPQFGVSVTFEGKTFHGSGPSKQTARQNAAETALVSFVKPPVKIVDPKFKLCDYSEIRYRNQKRDGPVEKKSRIDEDVTNQKNESEDLEEKTDIDAVGTSQKNGLEEEKPSIEIAGTSQTDNRDKTVEEKNDNEVAGTSSNDESREREIEDKTPWVALASFAIYKLLNDWKEGQIGSAEAQTLTVPESPSTPENSEDILQHLVLGLAHEEVSESSEMAKITKAPVISLRAAPSEQMSEEIKENGKRLAEIVKSTHKKLRTQLKIGKDEEEIWHEHIQNKEELKQYAAAMQSLATECWDLRKHINTSRIEWVVDNIRKYYHQKGCDELQDKEQRKVEYLNLKDKCQEVQSHDANSLKVLDVGSCYNPFAKFPDLDVTAIDLCPANESVKQCDFLGLEVNSSNIDKDWNAGSSITAAPEQYFDVIIFSLLLEYIPSPKQRALACKKAYKLLKTNGILCIITPDSKHSNANVHICKLWKITLGFLGFARTKYEKMNHFHGMTFRKGMCPVAWAHDAERELEQTKKKEVRRKFKKINYDNIQTEMFIPQDFEEKNDSEENYI